MYPKVFVLLAAFAATTLAQVQVNTPASVQSCLPVQLTWSGGKPPYFLGLIAGGQPSSPILKDFGQQTGTSFTWPVDAPSGTSYTVQIRDSDGQINYSDQFTVQPSSQTCTTSVGGPGATANTTSSSTVAGKNSSSPASTSSTNSTTKTGGTSATSSSTRPSTSTSSSNTTSGSTVSNLSSNSTASAAKTSGSNRLASGIVGFAVSLAVAALA